MEKEIYILVGYENTDNYSCPEVDVFSSREDAINAMTLAFENAKNAIDPSGSWEIQENTKLAAEDQHYAWITNDEAYIVDRLDSWSWEIWVKPVDFPDSNADSLNFQIEKADKESQDIPGFYPSVYAEYRSYWDNKTYSQVRCKVNTESKRVFAIIPDVESADLDVTCTERTVKLPNEEPRDVINIDDFVKGLAHDKVVSGLEDIQRLGLYWYSGKFNTLDEAIRYDKKENNNEADA